MSTPATTESSRAVEGMSVERGSILNRLELILSQHPDISIPLIQIPKVLQPAGVMLASCCGTRAGASHADLESGRGMDELSVKLRDGQPGTLRCNTKVVELLGSQ
jgi:hypothetical protein